MVVLSVRAGEMATDSEAVVPRLPVHLRTWAVGDRGLMAAEETCLDNCSLERAKVSELAQASATRPVSHRMTQSRRGQVTCTDGQSEAKEHVPCPVCWIVLCQLDTG